MDANTISWNLLVQIPLAALVVFLTLKFLGFIREIIQKFVDSIKEINETNQRAETERQVAVLDFISKQEDTNRAFLSSQRDQMNLSISRLAEEIKNNKVETLRELAGIVGLVDKVIDKVNVVTDKLRDIALVVSKEK